MSLDGHKTPSQTLEIDLHSILGQFWKAAPHGAHAVLSHLAPIHTLAADNALRESRVTSVTRIRAAIENDRVALMRQAGLLIAQYLNRFRVRSETADPFKICYWFGVALADKLGAANENDKRSVLWITVEMLDLFCETQCGKQMPADMRAKMNMSIAEGKHLEEFGHHGLYHSFKSVAKAYC
jgi:hypothetical protein